MAPKSPLFMLVLVLAVTAMALSVQGVTNVQAPVDAPIYAPTYAPTSPLPYGFGNACVAMCFTHCRPIYPRRRCMRTCTACCLKSRCVPEFSKCCVWDTVTVRGNAIKCP